MKTENSFPREEKLKSKKLIGRIFTEGYSAKAYPIRIQFVFHDIEDFATCQVGVSVPKRNFKSAVDRNRIKRQIKEAYRLNKSSFLERLISENKKIAMMVIFGSNQKLEYLEIEKYLISAINKIRI